MRPSGFGVAGLWEGARRPRGRMLEGLGENRKSSDHDLKAEMAQQLGHLPCSRPVQVQRLVPHMVSRGPAGIRPEHLGV